jgi:hypothetical protein
VGKSKDDTKLKSWILLLAGLAGIGYQQWTGEVHWVLLLIFTTMTGIPLTGIVSLLRNSLIVSQSSSSQRVLSESELDNASQNSLDGNPTCK